MFGFVVLWAKASGAFSFISRKPAGRQPLSLSRRRIQFPKLQNETRQKVSKEPAAEWRGPSVPAERAVCLPAFPVGAPRRCGGGPRGLLPLVERSHPAGTASLSAAPRLSVKHVSRIKSKSYKLFVKAPSTWLLQRFTCRNCTHYRDKLLCLPPFKNHTSAIPHHGKIATDKGRFQTGDGPVPFPCLPVP